MPIAPQTRSRQGIWLAIVLAFAALALTFVLISRAHPLPEALLRGTRWALVGALLVYAFLRRSLMTWIFACMVIGGIFGHELPQHAVKFQIVTQIFLRLIKAIIAPLIFSTLVVGIAGHSDLKQVGRMGLKALVYFEIVTTLALIIGIGAINFSKAGVGVQPPQNMQMEQVATPKQSASDVILHIF